MSAHFARTIENKDDSTMDIDLTIAQLEDEMALQKASEYGGISLRM